jgi:hypothetical protein
MAGLFTGDLERHHRITAPPVLGQPAEHVLQQVAEAFHRILPTGGAARSAMSVGHPHSETFFHRVSIVLYLCAFSQLNFTGRTSFARLFLPLFGSFFTLGCPNGKGFRRRAGPARCGSACGRREEAAAAR